MSDKIKKDEESTGKKKEEFEVEELDSQLEDVAGGSCGQCDSCSGCSGTGCGGCGAIDKEAV